MRVRYRPDGEFAPPFSYAVCRPDDEWPSAPFSVVETDAGLEIRTETLICRVERSPCRLAFLDLDGAPISEDERGAGYCDDWVGCFRLLDANEHIYGLGEKATGPDHRGQRYEMWNTDPQTYSPGDDPLYMSFPVYLGLREGNAYGLFFDNAYRSIFDIGHTDPSTLHFVAAGGSRCASTSSTGRPWARYWSATPN